MAQPPADDATTPPGTLGGTLGPYRLLERLGARGRFGAWRGTDDTGRPVTLMIVTSTEGGRPQSEADLERFAAGAERVEELRHSNVLQLLAHGVDGGRLYLVGEPPSQSPLSPLGGLLRERQPTIEQAIGVFQGVLAGLAAAHQKGVVHGEIHPDTVLVSPDLQQVKLTGFGLGRPEGLPGLGTTGTLSTGEVSLAYLAYLAPEQADGKPASARSDLYSAGMMFNQMLTGKPPASRFTLPTQVNPQLPPQLDTLVLKCLARNPADRYHNVQHLLGDLTQVEELLRLRLMSELKGISRSIRGQSGQLGQGTTAPAAEAAAKPGRSPLLWVGIAAAVVVVAIVVFFLLRH